MNHPATLKVTDQVIDLSGLSSITWGYFENLAESVIKRYQLIDKERVVFALAGPGGAGKSVVSAILAHLINEKNQDFKFMNVSLDAYHYTNQTLTNRGLREVKGRYDTYDISALQSDLVNFKAGKLVQFPTYSRQLHEPIPKNLCCESEKMLLWLEGGWLLYPEGDWQKLHDLFDYTYFITASEADVSRYVIDRHIRGGRELTGAKNFYEQSDIQNIKLVLGKSLPANENLKFWHDIE